MILIWPAGEFKRLPRGTTAGEIVHDQVTWNTNYVSHPARSLALSHCCSDFVHARDMLVTKAALLATDRWWLQLMLAHSLIQLCFTGTPVWCDLMQKVVPQVP